MQLSLVLKIYQIRPQKQGQSINQPGIIEKIDSFSTQLIVKRSRIDSQDETSES